TQCTPVDLFTSHMNTVIFITINASTINTSSRQLTANHLNSDPIEFHPLTYQWAMMNGFEGSIEPPAERRRHNKQEGVLYEYASYLNYSVNPNAE
ncbi:Hypothetical protein FKW44_001992, partial [Caligus rogercresseyi]